MTLAKPLPPARLPLARVSVERRLRRNLSHPRLRPRRPSPSRRNYVNGYPLDRPRFRRYECRPVGFAQDMMRKVEEVFVPHDETQGSQMYEGVGKVGALRDESRPF